MERYLIIHDRELWRGAALAAVARLRSWGASTVPTYSALETHAASRHRYSLRHGCIVKWCGAGEVSPLVHALRGPDGLWEGGIIALVPKGSEEIAASSRLGGHTGPRLTEIGAVTIQCAVIPVAELVQCIQQTRGVQIDRWLDALSAHDIVEPLRIELNALDVARNMAAITGHCERIRTLLFQANLDMLGHAEAARIRKELTRRFDIADGSALSGWVGTAREAVRQLERAWMKSEF